MQLKSTFKHSKHDDFQEEWSIQFYTWAYRSFRWFSVIQTPWNLTQLKKVPKKKSKRENSSVSANSARNKQDTSYTCVMAISYLSWQLQKKNSYFSLIYVPIFHFLPINQKKWLIAAEETMIVYTEDKTD